MPTIHRNIKPIMFAADKAQAGFGNSAKNVGAISSDVVELPKQNRSGFQGAGGKFADGRG